MKDREIHVANVGDCRVVLSRNGVATPLTNQHRLCREDERLRIENSVSEMKSINLISGSVALIAVICKVELALQGGFVDCRNGVWRVSGSLAVSRAIGDLHLKEWVISEPEIHRLPLTPDCEFLIMASDGLWDKVRSVHTPSSVQSSNKKIIIVFFSCVRS